MAFGSSEYRVRIWDAAGGATSLKVDGGPPVTLESEGQTDCVKVLEPLGDDRVVSGSGDMTLGLTQFAPNLRKSAQTYPK